MISDPWAITNSKCGGKGWLRWCRILPIHRMKSLDVSDEAQQDRVKQLVGEAVFKNLAMRVKIDKTPEADTPVDAFITELKKIPCLHFAPVLEEEPDKK